MYRESNMKVQFTLNEEDIKNMLWAYNANIEDLALSSDNMEDWIVDFNGDSVTVIVEKEM